MKRSSAFSTALLVALAACGGGEPEPPAGAAADAMEEPAEPAGGATDTGATGELQMPEWYQYDEASNTVTLDIVAGQTSARNYWNFNGYADGEIDVVVPAGATVTVNFTNEDPNNMVHSVGVAPFTSTPPAMVEATPVFDGAISPNAESPTDATAPGDSAEVTFTADAAGEYSLTCYVPGHAVGGMWVLFTVSDSGEAGVRGAL